MLAGEIEELRTQLESTERARKTAEGELYEASDRVSELTTQVSTLTAAKRKLERRDGLSTWVVALEGEG